MQAIVTKFIGPTNYLGSRYKAKAAAGSVTVSADYSLGLVGNHTRAAESLARKLGWSGKWVGGGNPDDSGFTFVCIDGAHDATFSFE